MMSESSNKGLSSNLGWEKSMIVGSGIFGREWVEFCDIFVLLVLLP